MTRVGWGIVGIGQHADARMAPAVNRVSNGYLAAVYSRDQERADAFGAKHGGARGYDDLDAMLADEDVQAVYVGSPNALHAPQSIACLNAGRHVLCDKPMATSIDDCEAMIAASERSGALLVPGYNVRYQPVHTAARQMVLGGEVGELDLVKVEVASAGARRGGGSHSSWRTDPAIAGGGSIINTGPHAIDMLRYVTGREVVEVFAMSDVGAAPEPVEELTIGLFRMEGNLLVQFLTGRHLPFRESRIEVHGTRGRLRTTGTVTYDISGRLDVLLESGPQTYEIEPPAPGYDLFTAEVEHMNDVILKGGETRATGVDGLEGLRVMLALQESARTNQLVRLERPAVA